MTGEREPRHRMRLMMSRRTLLASAAAFAALAPGTAFARTRPAPPVARVTDFSEVLHGVRIADPYRWMENGEDPDWRPFLEGQGAYARAVLDSIPGRAALLQRISDLTAASTMANQLQSVGTRFFTLARPPGSSTLCLMVRDGREGRDRLLLDPNRLAPAGGQAGLDYLWKVSPNGRYVVCGVMLDGSENTILHVVDVETGHLLPDRIDRTNFASPSWAPDSSGFFYNRLASPSEGGAEAYAGSVGRFHRLGDDPSLDLALLGRGLSPDLPVGDLEIPMLRACGKHLVGALFSGVDQNATYYLASTVGAQQGRPVWRRVCGKADEVASIEIHGDDLYLLSHKGAPRGRLLKTSVSSPELSSAEEVAPEGPLPLVGLAAARDGLFLMASDVGVHRISAVGADGAIREVRLPFEGAAPWGFNANRAEDGVWLVLQSWVVPQTACRVRADGSVETLDISKAPPADLARYAFSRAEVTARDGVKVPLSIIHPRSASLDGSSPLIMTAYGSYGVTLEPRYTPADIAWLEAGGVLAVAHVRGGGDRGDAWHEAGRKSTKPNSWRDLIDCGRWLVDRGWTSRHALAIQGKSAGGIVVGRALTEAPDLFGAVISRVGVSNPLRSEAMPSGPANVPEYGSRHDPAEFPGLLAMDAYHHVRPGLDYPHVLLTTGLNDTLVMPWQPAKMAARLQAASPNPVLLRVETAAGHGLGLSRSQEDEEKADIFAFVLWAAGHPDFQPPAVP
ncbi:prolyl oligopeptidase family serine peptidase [Sphingosinicella sp. CPCC 101087]|uniref:prolyl oligopeptidase family serine peptidase n=1 Tax=Sphingosinicella sp. CPCC 101087 TaxID=2497754 RepID=UPI0013ECB47C|nr:prolyl oligopeptidase family serine peptidase [Sphingosinicella sp. CPCC 101087]